MRSIFSLLVLAPALALAETPPPAATQAPAPAASKLVVLPILGKLPKPRRRMLEEALIDAAEAALAVQVMGPADAREVLTPKERRAFAKCKKEACFARLAQPLGATWMLATQAKPAKGQLKLNLVLIDGQAKVLDRRTPTVAGAAPQLATALERELKAMRAALPAEATPEPAPEKPAQPAAEPTPAAETSPVAAAKPAEPAPPPEATAAAEPARPPEQPADQPAATASQSDKPGWLGVQHSTVDHTDAQRVGMDSARGTLVEGVAEGGPGAKAGLRAGDVILACQGKAIPTAQHLAELLKTAHAGDTLVFTLWRDGSETPLNVTLAERPQ